MVLSDAEHMTVIHIELDQKAHVIVQDSRQWNDNLSVLLFLDDLDMDAGEVASLKVTLWATGERDRTPAHLAFDADKPLYTVLGLGGSYCYSSHSPITKYTLDHLPVGFTRCSMELREWEPNAPKEAHVLDWGELAGHDRPNTLLRQNLEMMGELSARKLPLIASVWRLPVWLYSEPKEKEYGNKVPRAKWPALIDCIGSYLVYAKEKYKGEPDYFSFNEPVGGVKVDFSRSRRASRFHQGLRRAFREIETQKRKCFWAM